MKLEDSIIIIIISFHLYTECVQVGYTWLYLEQTVYNVTIIPCLRCVGHVMFISHDQRLVPVQWIGWMGCGRRES